ncbi:hypothetical protein [Algibacillus agarilyticus]|uniref:hypothetical protein n=1 Tax=Algibacillus agarilyticus TaxID=2234133 RepID=UPI000DD067C4|nr:hypothetical protein [Algibacillus agarilyticus]
MDTIKSLIVFIVVSSWLLLSNLAQSKDIIRYNVSAHNPSVVQSYPVELLTLIMQKSESTFGPYELVPFVAEIPRARTSKLIAKQSTIDITWRMTSQALEKELQAIYIPLIKGMLGYRIFIIHQDNQPYFTRKTTLDTLKKMRLGQGFKWSDNKILRHNGFNVVEASKDNLLIMLKKQRFDFYPRGIYEPWQEIENEPELIVEKHILLKYPAPMYFFVGKQNHRLHYRLLFGFEQLIASGEFTVFFKQHPLVKNLNKKVNINERIIYTLTNPDLSKKTKQLTFQPQYWINNTLE